MRKNYLKTIATMAIAGASLVGVMGHMPDASALKAKERAKVYANTVEDVMITKIVPAEPRVEITYRHIDPDFDGMKPRLINIEYGNISDYELYGFEYGVKNKKIYMGPAGRMLGDESAVWNNGVTLVANRTYIATGIDLVNGTNGLLYYLISYNSGDTTNEVWQVTRVDYSRCLNSSVFRNGLATECRLEEVGGGRIRYQPYTADGTRVEIPEDEDARLTVATMNREYEYGWPDLPDPEPEPVEPDPELIHTELEPVESGVTESAETELGGQVGEIIREIIREREFVVQLAGAFSNNELGAEKEVDKESVEKTTESNELNVSTREEVDVPNLGRETDDKTGNVVTAIAVISAMGVALVSGWWLLFLGKHKSKERKEGKE